MNIRAPLSYLPTRYPSRPKRDWLLYAEHVLPRILSAIGVSSDQIAVWILHPGGRDVRLRSVEPGWLDILPADDPSTPRSRRDLQHVPTWMEHSQILNRVIRPKPSFTVIDLGDGDGRPTLRLVRGVIGCSR